MGHLVAAAVIRREGRLLLGRRPVGKRHGGLWEFPGGKLRDAESIEDAIARELREELGMETIRVGRVLHRAPDPESSFLICFIEVEASGAPKPLEHSEVAWCEPPEILEMDLAPADRQFAVELLSPLED